MPDTTDGRTISFQAPSQLRRQLKTLAERGDRTVSATARRLLGIAIRTDPDSINILSEAADTSTKRRG